MTQQIKSEIDYDDPRFRTSPAQQMAASCTGALLTSLLVTPLDVVKIRLQAQQHLKAKCFLYCNGLMDHLCSCGTSQDWLQRPGHFNGTIDAFLKITRNEGMFSLWSGLGPTLILAVPTTVLYFVTYEQLRFRLKDYYNLKMKTFKAEQPFWIPIMSGATARTFAVSVVSPLELVRTKMQSERLNYTQVGIVLGDLVQKNGWTSLWKGLVPTLLRDVPFSAIYWVSYETLKSFSKNDRPTFGSSFFCGATAGTLAATVTIPFDVVKTHQQIDFGEKEIFTEKPYRSKSTIEVVNEIIKIHGVRGLFTGLVPRVVKVAPACAIMISTFEYSKQIILHEHENLLKTNSLLIIFTNMTKFNFTFMILHSNPIKICVPCCCAPSPIVPSSSTSTSQNILFLFLNNIYVFLFLNPTQTAIIFI